MRRAIVIPLLCAAGLVAGCGATVSTSKFSGEGKNVAKALSDLQTDARGHDESKICNDILASSVINKLKTAGSDCQNAIKHQLDQIDNYDLTVQTVNVTGTTATARVKSISGGKDHFDTLALVQEGGRWKLAALGG